MSTLGLKGRRCPRQGVPTLTNSLTLSPARPTAAPWLHARVLKVLAGAHFRHPPTGTDRQFRYFCHFWSWCCFSSLPGARGSRFSQGTTTFLRESGPSIYLFCCCCYCRTPCRNNNVSCMPGRMLPFVNQKNSLLDTFGAFPCFSRCST